MGGPEPSASPPRRPATRDCAENEANDALLDVLHGPGGRGCADRAVRNGAVSRPTKRAIACPCPSELRVGVAGRSGPDLRGARKRNLEKISEKANKKINKGK